MRLGIVGCGRMGEKRAAACGDHVIAFVTDVDPERARSLAKKVGARVLKDSKAVAESDVDAVIVSTTHDSLVDSARAAVEVGKHVLVEKPGARTADELQPLVQGSFLLPPFLCSSSLGLSMRLPNAVVNR